MIIHAYAVMNCKLLMGGVSYMAPPTGENSRKYKIITNTTLLLPVDLNTLL